MSDAAADPMRALRAIVGPTASGKGQIGRLVAHRIGAEIVCLDSMKIYKGMDVGTAKPTAAARRDVRHHLIDRVEPHEPYNVFRYLQDAARACDEIAHRGAMALFVGGTPLYLKALLEGLFEQEASDPAYRDRLLQEADRAGSDALHARLQSVDSAAAARIHPHDLRRILRALEFHHTTGRPISEAQTQWNTGPASDAILVGIRWPRPLLIERIERRVERMFASGLPDEVQRIVSTGGFGRQAGQALGYKELLGAVGVEAAAEAIKRRTRQFARRQMTWFRRFEQIHWIDVNTQDDLETAAAEAARILAG